MSTFYLAKEFEDMWFKIEHHLIFTSTLSLQNEGLFSLKNWTQLNFQFPLWFPFLQVLALLLCWQEVSLCWALGNKVSLHWHKQHQDRFFCYDEGVCITMLLKFGVWPLLKSLMVMTESYLIPSRGNLSAVCVAYQGCEQAKFSCCSFKEKVEYV